MTMNVQLCQVVEGVSGRHRLYYCSMCYVYIFPNKYYCPPLESRGQTCPHRRLPDA